jgi:transformation/transcription domain-associated protein
LLKYPKETLDLLLNDSNIKDAQWNRFTIYLLKHEDGAPFRTVMESNSIKLINLILSSTTTTITETAGASGSQPKQQKIITAIPQQTPEQYEAQRQAILIVHTLIDFDEQWLSQQTDIVNALKTIWQTNLKASESTTVCDLWHLVAKILLHYFAHHTHDIDLLFQLLRALCLRFIPDFQFLRDFLQNTVCQSYTVEWKRKAFFHFVENFHNMSMSQDLKAKIMTNVLIPSFAVSFEKGEGNKLLGSTPQPAVEDEINVVSVFINKVSFVL